MEVYRGLCQRIVQYCHLRGWYGPDGALDVGMETERYVMEADGTLRHVSVTHDPRIGFEFAPASRDQLRATEHALGFALPPLLRAVYTQVANGGFGPGEGLTGVQGGYAYGQDYRYATLDLAQPPRWALRLADLGALGLGWDQHQCTTLPPRTWPTHFVHLCYWGCGTDSYLDALSEQVYEILDTNPVVLRQQEDSLQSWLETWLQERWRDWFREGNT
jgi:hypothetical protein